MTRLGWTLHEMLISLTVTAGIFVLASNAALSHLRFFRGTGEIVALRGQLGHAADVAAGVLRGIGGPEDILVAEDSAAEVNATYGMAFACGTDTGRVVVPAPSSSVTLSAFADAPQPGDDVRILVSDDSTSTWLGARLGAPPAAGPPCGLFPSATATWSLSLVEPMVIAPGAAVRVSRRLRINSYRASDGRWYLGLREWNGALGRFNGVQPVAGPLRPYSADPGATGFRLIWSDSAGTTVTAEPMRVASVSIVVRGESVRPARVAGLWSRAAPRYADSSIATVTLRNRP